MTFLETLAPHFQCRDSWKQKAWERLHSLGFPSRRWEAFQYVPLKALYETTFSPLEKGEVSVQKEKNTCVFVNGEFRLDLSSIENLVCLPLTEATRSYGMFLHKGWTQMLEEETNPFVLLNHALYEEGLFLYVPPKMEATIQWVFLTDGKAQIHSPKVELYLGKGSKLTIHSRLQGKGGYWHNGNVNAVLDEGSALTLDQRFSHGTESWGFHGLRARLKRDAKFQCLGVSKGAKVERHDLHATLMGENSEVDVKGLAILSAKAEIHQHLLLRHEAPHTRSNQHYKNVLMNRGRSSFTGKIFVEKEAQKTEAYQLNNNLLLSPEAKAMSQPNLEILADDVKASHGATFSKPKAEEIFYLRTRGLNEKEAERHLVKGFCRELIDDEVIDASL